MKKTNNRILTIVFTFLSGVIGGILDYYFQNENLHLKFSPALFGVGVLLANHASIRLRDTKFLAYVLVIPISIIVFVYGGLIFSIFGFGTMLSVYIGSGLCAVAITFLFKSMLSSIVIDLSNITLVFFSGAISLFIFFVANVYPLDDHFRGVDFDKFYYLSAIWQTLVGIAISTTVKKSSV